MRKQIMATIMLVFVMGMLGGCGHIQPLMEKLVPKISAKADALGLDVEIDPTVGFKIFCVNEGGKVSNFLNKIPLLGGVIEDAIGNCPVPEIEEIE